MSNVPTNVKSENTTSVITDISAENRAGYDLWATAYDTYVNATVAVDDRGFPPLWRHVIGRDVLEIGCGTGRHTVRLAAQGNRVTALDLSPGMLAVARGKLKDRPDVRLIEADITVDDIPGTFDAALSALVIEHIADLPRFFVRVAAALTPGGELFVSNLHPDKAAGGSGARFVDPDTNTERWLVNFAHSGDEVVAAARTAGFDLVAEHDAVGDQALADEHAEWTRYLGKPMIRMWIFSKA